MDPEVRNLLRRLADTTEENNRMLRKLYSAMKWGRLMKFLYWIFIIGLAFGAFYFIQPYIDQLMSVYGGIKGNIENVNGVLNKINMPR